MLRFAMIGCGRMGRMHSERLVADGRGAVTAYVDENRPAAERLRNEFFPAAGVFDSLDELLAEAPLEAAIVGTPTTLHLDQVRACRERGLHVLCEKPLADTREGIVTLVEESRSSGGILSVGYQRRTWATFRTLRREVHSGRWGAVRAVTSHNVENWQQTIGGTWRDDPAINAGGFIGDAGSHKLDVIFYVTGLRPVEVFAQTWNCGSRVEILGTVAARLEGDVPLSMDFIGNAQYLGEDLHIHCAEADLMVRDWKLWIARNGKVDLVEDLEPESNPVSAFIDLLLESRENFAPPECALPVYDMTLAILHSARTREIVPVSR